MNRFSSVDDLGSDDRAPLLADDNAPLLCYDNTNCQDEPYRESGSPLRETECDDLLSRNTAVEIYDSSDSVLGNVIILGLSFMLLFSAFNTNGIISVSKVKKIF